MLLKNGGAPGRKRRPKNRIAVLNTYSNGKTEKDSALFKSVFGLEEILDAQFNIREEVAVPSAKRSVLDA
jgi:hypothetical protein